MGESWWIKKDRENFTQAAKDKKKEKEKKDEEKIPFRGPGTVLYHGGNE